VARVLLVDDDTDLVEIYRAVLEHNGHRVTAAHSVQQTWSALEQEVPDVLVLGVMMEEFDPGFCLAHDVTIRHPSLPIVLLVTVHDYMTDAWRFDRGKDKGWLPVHRFLEKPTSPEQLLAAISGALADARSR